MVAVSFNTYKISDRQYKLLTHSHEDYRLAHHARTKFLVC